MAFLAKRTMTRVLLIVLTAARLHAYGETFDEYSVKAVFLFNLAKFVEWPNQAFTSANEPFVVCVLGQDPFAAVMKDAVRGRVIGNKKVEVRDISDIQSAGKCHILFVSASEHKRFRAILAEIKGDGVLTVGESAEFVGSGGMINLTLKDARFHMEIDPDAAERAKLRISSKLLSLAEITRK
jgi:hypothetical protein